MSNGDEIAEFEFKDGRVCSHRNVARVCVYVKGKKRCVTLNEIRGLIEEVRNAPESTTMTGPVPNYAPVQNDPWMHRSAGMRCRTCMWFVEKTHDWAADLAGTKIGRCRRHAPTMNGYPVCFEDDWCGDRRLDENKV